ncbi:MAG TPA: serine/threonine protein kinase [Gammaproteobacteria bacterium]|nr:serine/threonine protein kinase [Gammaproteobacteria bacterium]
MSMPQDTAGHPYDTLQPSLILDAVETTGVRCDGRLLALNSYENRVFQVGLEDTEPVVVKFYRPGRWSDQAILEEHAFGFELDALEIPVVAPLRDADGISLHRWQGFRFAVFPRRGGHPPELESPGHLQWLGRFIGRIHAVGAVRPFHHRPSLDLESFGHASRRHLLDSLMLLPEVREAWASISAAALEAAAGAFQRAGDFARIRLHGDCHPGNILWTGRGPHFVDLDDCRGGPAMQDLWMLLSGDREAMAIQLGHVLAGYTEFRDFDPAELHLVEALRTLRMLHHSAWLAQRWNDPAFPRAFPWFGSARYWQEQVVALREQLALMDAPPLPWL